MFVEPARSSATEIKIATFTVPANFWSFFKAAAAMTKRFCAFRKFLGSNLFT